MKGLLLALAVGGALLGFSCGGDDTDELRAEVAALQTQLAEPTATDTPTPSPTPGFDDREMRVYLMAMLPFLAVSPWAKWEAIDGWSDARVAGITADSWELMGDPFRLVEIWDWEAAPSTIQWAHAVLVRSVVLAMKADWERDVAVAAWEMETGMPFEPGFVGIPGIEEWGQAAALAQAAALFADAEYGKVLARLCGVSEGFHAEDTAQACLSKLR